MRLLIDAGNTRVKWALAAPGAIAGQWLACGVAGHAQRDSLAEQWQHLDIDAVLVSNVAGADVRAALQAQLQGLTGRCGVPPVITWFASTACLGGVRNHYRDPASLGCDRFASLIGARHVRPGQSVIVATCGTATTVDAMDAQGDFIGGMILPGLGLMAASLARRTAQLPQIAAAALPAAGAAPPFADNTQDAIHAGCLAAQAGAIERAVAAHGGAHCLLSGGAAAWIAPYLSMPFTLVDNLVLIGLHAASTFTELSGAEREC